MEKPFWKSWTVWFNVALLAIDFINQLAKIIPIPLSTLALVGILGNILLRFKTDSGITLN